MPEYMATIEKNLLNGEWVIRVRYVCGSNGERRKFASFVLVPRHQGMMFSEACADIERAIGRHERGLVVNHV